MRAVLPQVLELTQRQLSVLDLLRVRGFTLIAFPMCENYVGVKKDNCAALLAPVVGNGFKVFGDPCHMLNGHLTVRIRRDGRDWFVWKKERLEVTTPRLEELWRFSAELSETLLPGA